MQNCLTIQLRVICVVLVLSMTGPAFGQKSAVYTHDYKEYYNALDLFEKEKYTAARHKFEHVVRAINDDHDEVSVNAQYYAAISALKVFHKDAEHLLREFVRHHPESPHVQPVYMELGRHYYGKRRWRKAIPWFEKVDRYKLTPDQLDEYYFKLGYAYFREDRFSDARLQFAEIKNAETEYKNPALYYYSHIAYDAGDYQVALEGFQELRTVEGFESVVPYYIAQILYLQERYARLIDFAPVLLDSVKPQKEADIARIVGEAYYHQRKYDESVEYLEIFHRKGNPDRDDHYQLAFAYYQSGLFKEAVDEYDRVVRSQDSLSQVAYYQMADCYLKMDEKTYAQNAFKAASELSFDGEIRKDALFKYAKLSYDLSFNPYDEAIEAFQTFIREYPNSERKNDAYQYLINVYMTTKNYKAAMASLENMAEKDIRMQTAYQLVAYNRGVELYHNNKFDAAVSTLKKVKTYPLEQRLNALSKYWIAECYYRQGMFDRAIRAYEDFIKEPGAYSLDFYRIARYNLGYCHFRDGKYEAAIDEFRQFVDKPGGAEAIKVNDAYLRIADAYYLQKKDKDAIRYYRKAIQMNSYKTDYAHFQKAMSHGYLKEYEDKIEELEKIIKYFTSSSNYVVRAKFEIAETYRVQDERAKALDYYNQVVEEFPNNLIVRKSLLNIGLIHYKNEDYSKAEKVYIRVLKDYPNPDDCKEAVAGLKDVYTAVGDISKLENVIAQYGCEGAITEEDIELTYFDAAMNFYYDENCEQAVDKFDAFLNKYPNSSKALNAHFYKAECLYKMNLEDEALVHYEKVLDYAANKFTESSLVRAASINFNLNNFNKSLTQYINLERMATLDANQLAAKIGQMRCFYHLQNWPSALEYARLAYQADGITDNVRVEATLIMGIAHREMKNLEQALERFEETVESTEGIRGAEAQYYIAEIYYNEDSLEQSEKEVFELVRRKPSYDYWVAKGYILLADIYVKKGDTFQAKHTLQSIIDNYTADDDIVPTAQEKLEAILAREAEEAEGPEEGEMEIDLNNEDGNGEEDDNENQENE